jgi:hypothetical protein
MRAASHHSAANPTAIIATIAVRLETRPTTLKTRAEDEDEKRDDRQNHQDRNQHG